MNSIHPSLAFASTSFQECSKPCTDSGDGRCVYKGITANSCIEAQLQANKTNLNNVKLESSSPISISTGSFKPKHQRLAQLNATGSATQQANNRFFDAQAGVGVGLGLPGSGPASLNNIQSAIDNTLSHAGIPPAILGVSTPLLIATGVAGVILLLLVVKR